MLYVNPISPALTGQAAGETRQKAALQEFEHMFLYSLLREMNQTVGVTGEKKGREMQLFEEMLDDALSGQMARSGQVGIARQIEQQLSEKRNLQTQASAKAVTTAQALTPRCR